MYLLSGQTVLKSYDFGLGNEPIGHKQLKATERPRRASITSTVSIPAVDTIFQWGFPIRMSGTELLRSSSDWIRAVIS